MNNVYYSILICFLGMQIPQDVLEIESFKSKAKYVLIIEKNATFQKIINEGLLKRNECSFIIITVRPHKCDSIDCEIFIKLFFREKDSLMSIQGYL